MCYCCGAKMFEYCLVCMPNCYTSSKKILLSIVRDTPIVIDPAITLPNSRRDAPPKINIYIANKIINKAPKKPTKKSKRTTKRKNFPDNMITRR